MKINDVITGEVVKIEKTHFIVRVEDGWQGMVHISGVSDYFVSNIKSMFNVGVEYNFKIIDVDNKNKRLKLDWKSIHPRFLKNPFKYEIKETESGFENLIKNTEKEVEND